MTADRSYEPFGSLPGGSRLRQEPDWTHIPHVPAGDVGADHNHDALGANRQQSTCHNAPIDAMWSKRVPLRGANAKYRRHRDVIGGSDTDNPFR